MNGPLKMYRSRQIVRHDLKISLPECMYKMKNIHATSDETGPLGDHVSPSRKSVDISQQVKQFLKSLQHQPEMAALIERQQKILQQLDELRQQMVTLKSDLSTNNGPMVTVIKVLEASSVCSKVLDKLPKILINASPSNPPYSLLLIQRLWDKSLHLKVTSHLHSSISALPEKANALSKALDNHHPLKQQLPVLEIKLIWKDIGPNMELMIAQTPIVGEVNFLRYLGRIIPNLMPYESLEDVYEIDSILDTCYCLVGSHTKAERASLIQSLNKKLGKSEWLCGKPTISIADIAASSAIKQVALNEINQNLSKWLQRCEALIA